MPVDHDRVDGRPEKVEKLHAGEDSYIGPLAVVWETRKCMSWERRHPSV